MEDKFKNKIKKLINNYISIQYQNKILIILIILLHLIQISNSCINSKNAFKFLINLNQIKIKIKGPGTQNIINSGFLSYIDSVEYDNTIVSISSQLNLNSCVNTVIITFSSSLTSCSYMFSGCNKIIEIDLTDFDSSQIKKINNMFDGCTSLKSINFGSFQTSNVNDMLETFENCEQLETLDLSSFITTQVTDFHYMFAGCKSLKKLDLSNFRTSNGICMHHMFQNCISLVSLDLSNFDITTSTTIEDSFKGCSKLEYVNLINANIETIKAYGPLISNIAGSIIFCIPISQTSVLKPLISSNTQASIINVCSNLLSYKRYLSCYLSCNDCDHFGNSKNHRCKQCGTDYNFEIEYNGFKNCYRKCSNLFYIDDNNILTCLDCTSCPNEYSKLLKETNQCIKNCSLDKEYIYEYKNTCVKECPIGSKESAITKFLCLEICNKGAPLKIISTDNCVPYCPIDDIVIDNCELNYKEKNENIEDKILYSIQTDLTHGYDISKIDTGTDIFIERNSTTYIITSTENQKKETNRININLGTCETKLKNHYHIPLQDALYMLKIEINLPGMKIPKIEYEVYYPKNGNNLIKLDLSLCKNEKIEIAIPVELKDDLYKYDPQSEYYNDICYTYKSDSGTDITLSDRHEDFVENNMTLCEEDCTFVR